MIVNGIKVRRIKIPAKFRGLYVYEWPGAADWPTPDYPGGKIARLVWKLARAAAMRWTLAPADETEWIDVNGTSATVDRDRALEVLPMLNAGVAGDSLPMSVVLRWAQAEVNFWARRDLEEACA